MARDYEVREEYKGYGLAQLLDSPVLCFQGVGEIPAQLLNQYFNITTVRDLANMTQFMWALELQELALNSGDLGSQSIRNLAGQRELKFRVRERCMDMTPIQLMHSSIQDLDGLTPAQDLALYDIFRITNIAQLAQNRIMLESRVIQYLEQGKGEGGELAVEGVASVLAQGQEEEGGSPTAAAVQRITEARRGTRDERLETAATETREHVRDRLETLRERAQGAPAATAAAAPAPGDRLSAIR
ncbi:MAG TPA: hypothetical protein VL359_11245, partial [bacterium]|nr:hypothetical protein [bacterium]